MEPNTLFFVIAAVVVIAMLAVWALAGGRQSADDAESAAGHALDDTVKEVTQMIEGDAAANAARDHALEEAAKVVHSPVASPAPTPTIEAAPKAAPAPAPVATPVTPAEVAGGPRIAAAVGEPDNLLQLKGVGPKLNTLLTDMGVTRFDQIAAWTDADVAEVDAHLGTFKGRIVRDNWIEQARFLAAGDIAGFEAKFGKL